MSCSVKVNSNTVELTVELTVHTSCYCVLDLTLCYNVDTLKDNFSVGLPEPSNLARSFTAVYSGDLNSELSFFRCLVNITYQARK